MTSNYRSILMSRVKSNLGQNEPHSVSDFLLLSLDLVELAKRVKHKTTCYAGGE